MNAYTKLSMPTFQNSARYLESGDIVIIGSGIAGFTAAVEARRVSPTKRIVMITNQIHPTINTPALKQYAIAKLRHEQLLAYPPHTERDERIHVLNAHVEEIQAQEKYLTLRGNYHFGYDSLLIATGSTPRGLPVPVPGMGFDGVMTLHRLQDYLEFRRRLPEVQEAVVIGGGAHANETVMSLLHWGIRVHWLLRGKTFMNHILDHTASEMVLTHARKAGVIVHREAELSAIIGRMASVAGVITNQHQMIPCQLVLLCTGSVPVMSLAQQCSVPILHRDGILVNEKLSTSVRGIYAAGDVAALRNPQTGSYETRAQWYAAVTMGRTVGTLMAGEERVHEPGVFWHATQFGNLATLTVGEPLSEGQHIETLTDQSSGGYRRLAIVDNRLVGYLSLGPTQPDSLAIRQIVEEGYEIRGVVRELLKGTFDARTFHSRLSARTAHGMLKNLPVAIPHEHRVRQTDPLVRPAVYVSRQTGPLRMQVSIHQDDFPVEYMPTQPEPVLKRKS